MLAEELTYKTLHSNGHQQLLVTMSPTFDSKLSHNKKQYPRIFIKHETRVEQLHSIK